MLIHQFVKIKCNTIKTIEMCHNFFLFFFCILFLYIVVRTFCENLYICCCCYTWMSPLRDNKGWFYYILSVSLMVICILLLMSTYRQTFWNNLFYSKSNLRTVQMMRKFKRWNCWKSFWSISFKIIPVTTPSFCSP